MQKIIHLLFTPWLLICRIFNLGKFDNWETEYSQPGHELYQIEPWHTCGCGNHSNCERKWCPYKCTFSNY